MFVDAIETADRYTRAIHTISRVWGSTAVLPGTASLFFVNADGWALTCKHVATQLVAANQLLTKFTAFKAERDQLAQGLHHRRLVRELERKHGYSNGVPVEMYNSFFNCVDGPLNLEARVHGTFDVALLKFSNYNTLGATAFPVFAQDGGALKQGKFLCRLGFPFPEFTNFEYDVNSDQIRWTTAGRIDTPRFPIEGMVTRHLVGPGGAVVGFELSTPGLRGQSGGPAFDRDGRVWGMQAATNHLDLDFDVDVDVFRNGQRRHVSDSAFLHVGHCVHVDVLRTFMREHGVHFDEAA